MHDFMHAHGLMCIEEKWFLCSAEEVRCSTVHAASFRVMMRADAMNEPIPEPVECGPEHYEHVPVQAVQAHQVGICGDAARQAGVALCLVCRRCRDWAALGQIRHS